MAWRVWNSHFACENRTRRFRKARSHESLVSTVLHCQTDAPLGSGAYRPAPMLSNVTGLFNKQSTRNTNNRRHTQTYVYVYTNTDENVATYLNCTWKNTVRVDTYRQEQTTTTTTAPVTKTTLTKEWCRRRRLVNQSEWVNLVVLVVASQNKSKSVESFEVSAEWRQEI